MSSAVPLLDVPAHLRPYREQLLAAFQETLDSGRFIMGPEVTKMEEYFCNYLGVKGAIGVSSGTDALLVSLMALDVKAGDLVITSPYSFFATAGVISRLGAVPVFVDVDQRTCNLCPDKLEEWFHENSEKVSQVKAVIPVHLYGQAADMPRIMEICERFNIPVIEDAAQALGATFPYKGETVKAGSVGTLGCYSFFPSKNLGCLGDGGMVVSQDEKLSEKVSLLRLHGAKPKYYHSLIGGNFRIDALQAACLNILAPHLDDWQDKRRENAAFYNKRLSHLELQLPHAQWGMEHHVFNQYVIVTPRDREELREWFAKKQIGCEVYYPVPFHLQKCFSDLGYKKGDFTVSEYLADHSLAIPVYPELEQQQLEYVASAIEEFHK